MKIAKVPLRVSFCGGQTDLPWYFEENEFGCVISSTINKYICVMRDEKGKVNQINDIPPMSGLGGSSSYVVGQMYTEHPNMNLWQLAEEAYHHEVNVMKNNVGKQDHYSAVFGGLNYIKFYPTQEVGVSRVDIDVDDLFSKLVFISLGQKKIPSGELLDGVKSNVKDNILQLNELKNLTIELATNHFSNFEEVLRESWKIKKSMSKKVTNNKIDDIYELGLKSGATCGKVCGSGGGGYLMMYFPNGTQMDFIKSNPKLKVEKFYYEPKGVQLV